MHHKRPAMTVALAAIAIAALLLAVMPMTWPVRIAEALDALAACIVTPSIAAITLRLCGHAAYGQRLGVNARYASLGAAASAALLGVCAWYFSERAVFIVTAAMVLPALAALYSIRAEDQAEGEVHPALLHPRERRRRAIRPWQIFREPALHLFAVCVVLFHLANAAMLPLALNELAKRTPATGLVVSAAIIVPQMIVAALSPWAGRMAQVLGRRPVLLAGFAALPARGLLFAVLVSVGPAGLPLVAIQVLDGISASVFGLSLPLIAADTTRRTGLPQSGDRFARPGGRAWGDGQHDAGRRGDGRVWRAHGLPRARRGRGGGVAGDPAGDAGDAARGTSRRSRGDRGGVKWTTCRLVAAARTGMTGCAACWRPRSIRP